MSSSTVTIVVPTAENETVFILHAVQAALKAYRKNHHRSDQGQMDDTCLATTTDETVKKTGTFGQPTSTTA